MSDSPLTSGSSFDRRRFLQSVSAAGLGAGLIGCAGGGGSEERSAGEGRRLRAAFSNVALENSWCKLGQDTAELWGKLLNVEVVWFDGKNDAEKQRNEIDAIVNEDWDFCCFQTVQTDSLAEPVSKLKKIGVPVISMDTLLVDLDRMREVGAWCQVMPDQTGMGEAVTQHLMDKIGGKGKVIHIGGLSAHSGAQGREAGFNRVLENYPDVEVVGGGVRWCDWNPEKARNTFQSLLQQENEPIAGAFFHNDDMAIASHPALKGTIHEGMTLVGVDGMNVGLQGVKDGIISATVVNPTCLIHNTALIVGQFIARNNEKLETVPEVIITPGPLVTGDDPRTLDAMLYLADPSHCMV